MHRLLSEVTGYFAELGRTSARAWRRFFFTPADPTPLAWIRLSVGAMLVWNLIALGPDLKDYLGSDGWIGPEALRAYWANLAPGAWSLWIWIPDAWLVPTWCLCLIVLTAFTLGLASRVTAPLAWAIAVSTARRAPVTLFGFDQMAATWTLYLAVTGASGQALSLDRLIARRRSGGAPAPVRPTVPANLGIRLIQIHLAFVYGSSGLSKLSGPEWWNGSALETILLTPEFRRLDPSWFLAHPSLLQFATHAGVCLEIAYPILIWVRPLRPVLLAGMVLMHAGIDLMLGLTEFSLVMIAANAAFLDRPRPSDAPAPNRPGAASALRMAEPSRQRSNRN